MIYVVRCERRFGSKVEHTRVVRDFEVEGFTYTDKYNATHHVDGFVHVKRMMKIFAEASARNYYPGSHLCHVHEGMDLQKLNNRPAIYVRHEGKTVERWYITKENRDEDDSTASRPRKG